MGKRDGSCVDFSHVECVRGRRARENTIRAPAKSARGSHDTNSANSGYIRFKISGHSPFQCTNTTPVCGPSQKLVRRMRTTTKPSYVIIIVMSTSTWSSLSSISISFIDIASPTIAISRSTSTTTSRPIAIVAGSITFVVALAFVVAMEIVFVSSSIARSTLVRPSI